MHKGQWHWRVSVLGAALCLLAVAFALEAKLGWYSPDGNVRVQFSSTKFQADAVRQTVEALVVPALGPHFPEGLPQLAAIAPVLPVIFIPRLAETIPPASQFSFSPPNFLRPPPRS